MVRLGSYRVTTVGIIGGLGPESTIDYYKRILDRWRSRHQVGYPHIVIDSLDVDRVIHLVSNDRPGLIELLSSSVERLRAAGVDFVTISANTPHIVYGQVAARSALPIMSIVDVCAGEAERRGYRNLLLLGTRFTMEAQFYPAAFERRGMKVTVPDEGDRVWLHEKYLGELLLGKFRDESRHRVEALVENLIAERNIDAVILGGTELPLLLGGQTIAGLPVLDTTELHVRAIVDELDR
jgi:aspartate racemase